MDSGASQDLVSRQSLDNKEIDHIKESEQKKFTTANGIVSVGSRVNMSVSSQGANITTSPFVLDNCPPILSLGQRIADGYSFEWLHAQEPHLIAPNGKRIRLRVDNHVPMIDSHVLKLLAAQSTDSCAVSPSSQRPQGSDENDEITDHSKPDADP